MAISDQINRLNSAKQSIKATVANKGVSIPDNVTLDGYPSYIEQIETQGKYQNKTVTPSASETTVTPDIGYDALTSVTVEGDSNLAPENIAEGVEIFGVTGTLESGGGITPSGTILIEDNGTYDVTNYASASVNVETGGGSNEYNIYVQNAEPTEKNGVWIKENKNADTVKFFTNVANDGEFLNPKTAGFMATSSFLVGQIIVNEIVYSFSNTATNSYKYDLKTETSANITVPTIDVKYGIGAILYKEKIYVFFVDNSRNFCYYTYDFNTDIYTSVVTTGTNFDKNAGYYECYTSPYLYDGKVYILHGFYSPNYFPENGTVKGIFDLATETFSVTENITTRFLNAGNSGRSSGSLIAFKNEYIYTIVCPMSWELRSFNILTNSIVTVKTFTTDELVSSVFAQCGLFAYGDYLYIFNDQKDNTFHKYNLSTQTLEKYISEYTYYLTEYSKKTTKNSNQAFIINETNGNLYIRQPELNISSFQYMLPPNLAGLEVGTIAIVQTPDFSNVAIMQDSSNIAVGIGDILISEEDEINGDLLCYWGDGEKWNLLKNPNDITATVTFDTQGGNAIEPQQVIIGGLAEKPENPSKDGGMFDYWEKDGQPYDFNTPVVGDMTLTAKYMTYEEVDYIESHGTEYIDTGVIANASNFEFEIAAQLSSSNSGSTTAFFGSRSSTASRIKAIFFNTNLQISYYFSDGYTPWTTFENPTNAHVYKGNANGNLYIDETLVGTATYSTTPTNSLSMFLFTLNFDGTPDSRMIKAKISYAKIWNAGTLVRDFVPIKTEYGVYGLLDKVNNVFYANAGTGEFTGGTTQEPAQLSYIESTGTQYIDTGLIVTDSNYDIDMKFNAIDNGNSNQVIFGGRDSSSTNSFTFYILNSAGDNYARYQRYAQTGVPKNSTYFDVDVTLTTNGSNLTITDGTNNQTFTDTGTFTGGTSKLLLFNMHSAGNVSDVYSSMKLYYCKIYHNDILVRNFLPYQDEYGVKCLYDTVESKYYYNAGTGEFLGE